VYLFVKKVLLQVAALWTMLRRLARVSGAHAFRSSSGWTKPSPSQLDIANEQDTSPYEEYLRMTPASSVDPSANETNSFFIGEGCMPSINALESPTEATSCDLAARLRELYVPETYAFTCFDAHDVCYWLVLSGVVDASAATLTARWFQRPATTLTNPLHFSTALGKRRSDVTRAALLIALEDYDNTASPLVAAIRRTWPEAHVASVAAWTSLLRGMCVALMSRDSIAAVPKVTLGCIQTPFAMVCGDTVSQPIAGDERARAISMVRLLLATCEEFGSRALLQHSLEIMRLYNIDPQHADMCQIMRATQKLCRRENDWTVRTTSTLSHKFFDKWLQCFFKRMYDARHAATVDPEVKLRKEDGEAEKCEVSLEDEPSESSAFFCPSQRLVDSRVGNALNVSSEEGQQTDRRMLSLVRARVRRSSSLGRVVLRKRASGKAKQITKEPVNRRRATAL
jgi:hypothetical protein